MSVLIYIIVFYIFLSLSLYIVFPKAGVSGVKGLIPGVNFVEWCRLIGRKPAFALWLLFPVVNIFIFCGMAVDLSRSFGKDKFWHAALSVIYAPFMFFIIGRNETDKYEGPVLIKEKEYKERLQAALASKNDYEYKKLSANNPFKKNAIREWVESIVFAVFAAAFIRMFLIEAYVIPTGSMEGSLLVGDYLFVSKVNYGIRLPQTVLQVPLLHNRMPVADRESYLTNPRLPYKRILKFNDVERFDPVVFNYPEGDSVYVNAEPGRTFTIHDVRRSRRLQSAGYDKRLPLTIRPMDKADHYIKRAIGMPGDSLQIRNRQVYINGEPVKNPSKMQFKYMITSGTTPIYPSRLEDIGVNINDVQYLESTPVFALNDEQVERIKSWGSDIEVQPFIHSPAPEYLFPHDPEINSEWTIDNYGPVYIPKAGDKIKLTDYTLKFFRRVIAVYEGNELEKRGNDFYINGELAAEYTFRQNYYWMMGDNRHSSEDARMWGYTPEENVVGKPLFIFFSTRYGNMRNGINWDRLFRSAYMMD